MKYTILVTGPNCSGKTTATERAMQLYKDAQEIKTLYADSTDKREFFSGSMEESRAKLAALWRSDVPILVIEGTNRVALLVGELNKAFAGEREMRVMCTHVSPLAMGEMLKKRCEKKGKKFRADYWTTQKLTYEGTSRYKNLMAKWFPRSSEMFTISANCAGSETLVAALSTEISEMLVEVGAK